LSGLKCDMVRVSLIVPTYNRAKYLIKSIPSFLDQTLPVSEYEILVIDNNSSDNTKEVTNSLLDLAKCSWRYIFEQRQGLHYARNRGILEALGDIVVFGDDDIIADKDWLETILHEFDNNKQAGIVGGKVVPLWDKQPPDWIYDYGTDKIHGVFAYLDHGPERLVLQDDYVIGCNFAIRRDLAIHIGGSYPDTFPIHLKHLSGIGEYGMIANARKLKHQIVYLPEAWVYHFAESSRATLEYFVDRHERWAVEEVYYYFRNYGIVGAIMRLSRSIIAQLLSIYLFNRQKRNIKYYRIIQKRNVISKVLQTLRVISDQSLYVHITKKSHL